VKRRTRNPEIPGLVLAHHPGMTFSINAIVSRRAGFSPLFGSTQGSEMCCPDACAAAPFGRTVDLKLRPDFQEKDQT
jgi:hypothetical protein